MDTLKSEVFDEESSVIFNNSIKLMKTNDEKYMGKLAAWMKKRALEPDGPQVRRSVNEL